jgi:hypothetical protein
MGGSDGYPKEYVVFSATVNLEILRLNYIKINLLIICV